MKTGNKKSEKLDQMVLFYDIPENPHLIIKQISKSVLSFHHFSFSQQTQREEDGVKWAKGVKLPVKWKL